MRFNPFSTRKKAMSQEKSPENEATTTSENPLAEEIKLSSAVEASEQMPVDEDPAGKLQAELSEMKDTHLRLFAEFENYKRRTLKERSDLIRSAGADTLTALLPVLDDFERALKANEKLENNPMKEGVLLIYNKLVQTLDARGLKAMQSIGTEFNVDLHEAITNVPAPSEDLKGKVIDEVEKGYYLNDKVIRYAKVVVGN